MTDSELQTLIAQSIAAFNALSPEEQRAHRREQRISWVYGQIACMRKGPQLTREEVAAIVDEYDARGQISES